MKYKKVFFRDIWCFFDFVIVVLIVVGVVMYFIRMFFMLWMIIKFMD